MGNSLYHSLWSISLETLLEGASLKGGADTLRTPHLPWARQSITEL